MFGLIRRQAGLLIALAAVLLFLAVAVGGSTAVVAGRDQDRQVNIVDVPVLAYHMVDQLYDALALSPQEFEEQMAYLHSNGYSSITPDQLMAHLKHGAQLPEKPVLLTFDDGYLDNYASAYPIMKKYGFTATIFLITDKVGHDSRYMNWDQVREMCKDGFVFGSHTVNHLKLTKLPAEQVLSELMGSRQEMERQLGKAPRYFAYPTGAYDLEIEQLVRQAGYRAAFTIRYGQVDENSDFYALERIPLFKSGRTFRSFFIRLNGAPLLERLGIIRN